MQLTRFTSASDFLARAGTFLVAHEAQHNMPLGLAQTVALTPDLYPHPPYFAVVDDGDTILLAAVRTPPYNLVLSLCESAAALELVARDVSSTFGTLPGVLAPNPVAQQFAEFWKPLTSQTYRLNMAERIYRLTTVIPVTGVPGHMRRVTEADRTLLTAWLTAFQTEALRRADEVSVQRIINNVFTMPPEVRGMFIWEDARPVCLVGYGGPTPHGIRIAPVYTPPEARRRGYASACTAAACQHLLAAGRQFITLFTDLANPTANHVYQSVGFEPVCDVNEYHFE